MRSSTLNNLFVILLTIGLMPAALWAQTDTNARWDPNTHLLAYPRTCQLSADYFLPEQGEAIWTSFDRKISLSGRIAVPDPNGLIGLSKYPTDIQAWDELGNPLESGSDDDDKVIYVPLEYAATLWVPTMEWMLDAVPYDFSLALRLDPDSPFPTALSRVEWSMTVLLSDRFEVIDIPYAETEDWTELVPGLEMLVSQAYAAEGQYNYVLQSRFDPGRVVHRDYRDRGSWEDGGYPWTETKAPELVVIAIDVLDAQGHSVHYQGSDAGSATVGAYRELFAEPAVVARHGIGNCQACGQAASFRLTLAYEPYEQEVRLSLEDVAVPSL